MLQDKFKVFPQKKTLYLIAIFGFLIVLLVELLVFMRIEAAVSTYGILDYEFAWTSSRILEIFTVWGLTDYIVK